MIPPEIEKLLSKIHKPARCCGGEPGAVQKDKNAVDLRVAFCFPDLYEVGMSNLGMKLLTGLFNTRADCWCERFFEPDDDLRGLLLERGLPLYSLDSFDPLSDFDIVAFTIQYEMCYTTILDMLALGGVPLRASQRTGLSNLVVGGGPCASNAEPLAEFFDLFFFGEGEELDMELLDLYAEAKKAGWSRREFLRRASGIEGVYVPSLYDVAYLEDGRVASITPKDGAPEKVRRRFVPDIDVSYYPDTLDVPFVDIIHNRVSEEVLRGCIRGCRFCQAGYLYRPFREKSPEVIDRQARALCGSTGYEEVSLLSLSTGDHSRLEEILERMLPWAEKDRVRLTLPSLRVDSVTPRLLELINRAGQGGLTVAPEAGSQRLRDAINKNLTEEMILDTCRDAFLKGYSAVKLYFMIGLPTETMEDVLEIDALAKKTVDAFYQLPERPKGRGVNVTASVAAFVPKPHTPFQYEPQDSVESFEEKQAALIHNVSSKKIRINYHDADTSRVEAILARGDRRLGRVIETVWRDGARLEAWREHFDFARWEGALASEGLSGDFYACRRRDYAEVLPWSMMDCGVTPEFFARENQKAHESVVTPNCREQCSGCGMAAQCAGGVCHAKR